MEKEKDDFDRLQMESNQRIQAWNEEIALLKRDNKIIIVKIAVLFLAFCYCVYMIVDSFL